MKLVYTIAVALILITTACSVEQSIHFNKDWSGKIDYKIDMSSMMAMAGDADTGDESLSMMNSPEMKTAIEDMRKVEGISNVRIEEDTVNGIYQLGYDFANLDVLNDAISGSDVMNTMNKSQDKSEESVTNHKYFVLRGKNLIFQLPKLKNDAEESTEGLEGMQEMMRYILKISFDRDIKKLSTESGAKKKGNKKIELDISLTELTNPDFNSTMKIKLGK